MLHRVFRSTLNNFPVSGWVMAIAAMYGLAHGSVHLGESADMATAVGIVNFLSLVAGAWLAVSLYRFLVRTYTVWISKIENRVSAVLAQLSTVSHSEELKNNKVRRVSATAWLIANSFYVTMFSCGAFTNCLLVGTLMTRIDGHAHTPYFTAAIASLVVILGSVIVQCSYFLYLHRKVAFIEQQIATIGVLTDEPIRVAQRAEVLDNGIAGTERFGRRLVGIRPPSSQRATV